jgi:formate dehydrogenase subunit gamma
MDLQGMWNPERAAEIIAAHRGGVGQALPILHALQEAFGFIPQEAVPMLAEALNVTRAEMHGVVSFYHDFRSAPAGRHVLKLCRAEACQAAGGERLAAGLLRRLGLDWGETTADARLTIEPVYCLGLCACAPSALLDGEPHGRLDEARLGALVEAAS